MKNITDQTEITKLFNDEFEPGADGAYATCRLIDGADSAMDPQEWCEYGTIGGAKAAVYYIFSGDEASAEDAESYPWDADHVDRIVIAEDEGDAEEI